MYKTNHEVQETYSFFSSSTPKESNRFGMSTQSFMHEPNFCKMYKVKLILKQYSSSIDVGSRNQKDVT
jgi:hypothetical protein